MFACVLVVFGVHVVFMYMNVGVALALVLFLTILFSAVL